MKVFINGFGRIGRAILRLLLKQEDMECVGINEPFATTHNMAYLLQYDSLYGTLDAKVSDENSSIKVLINNNSVRIPCFHIANLHELTKQIDEEVIIIEATGHAANIPLYELYCQNRVIVTSTSFFKDNEKIFGYDYPYDKSKLIYGSICDSVAVVPVLGALNKHFKFESVLITTMHPALNYQKVIDGYISNQDIALGRQYIDSLIPKRTSLENVIKALFKAEGGIRCLSYRTPTESVCSADISIYFKDRISTDQIMQALKDINVAKWIDFSSDEKVSIDFKGNLASCVVDLRWTEVINENLLKLVIWYDNEFGYSARIIDLIREIA